MYYNYYEKDDLKNVSFLYDFAFKSLYMKASKEVKKLLNDAINFYTQINLNQYDEMWQEIPATKNIYEKASKSDLNFISKDHTIVIDLEINRGKSKVTERRNSTHFYKMAGNLYKTEEDLKNVERKCYQINLNNYICSEGTDIYSSIFMMCDINNPELHENMITKYNIYLPTIKEKCYNNIDGSSIYEKTLAIISEDSMQGRNKLAGDNIKLKRLVQEMEKLLDDSLFVPKYQDEVYIKARMMEEYDDGFEKGVKQGIEQGKNETLKEIVIKLSETLSVEEISNKLNISTEEIENIINKKVN